MLVATQLRKLMKKKREINILSKMPVPSKWCLSWYFSCGYPSPYIAEQGGCRNVSCINASGKPILLCHPCSRTYISWPKASNCGSASQTASTEGLVPVPTMFQVDLSSAQLFLETVFSFSCFALIMLLQRSRIAPQSRRTAKLKSPVLIGKYLLLWSSVLSLLQEPSVTRGSEMPPILQDCKL